MFDAVVKETCELCPEMAIWLRKESAARRCRKHKPLDTDMWLQSLYGFAYPLQSRLTGPSENYE